MSTFRKANLAVYLNVHGKSCLRNRDLHLVHTDIHPLALQIQEPVSDSVRSGEYMAHTEDTKSKVKKAGGRASEVHLHL